MSVDPSEKSLVRAAGIGNRAISLLLRRATLCSTRNWFFQTSLPIQDRQKRRFSLPRICSRRWHTGCIDSIRSNEQFVLSGISILGKMAIALSRCYSIGYFAGRAGRRQSHLTLSYMESHVLKYSLINHHRKSKLANRLVQQSWETSK